MRVIRALLPAGFGLVLTLCLAPVSGAQEYTWIDERGSMHVASDPSEIPARFRKKAVEDAEKASSQIVIVPEEKLKGERRQRSKKPRPELTPEQKRIRAEYNRLEREERAKRVPTHVRDARDEEESRRERREREDEESAELDDKPHRDSAAPDRSVPDGFERKCNPVAGGGEYCRTVETESSARDRYQRAREKALDEMGVTEERIANDPKLKSELASRTHGHFKESGRDLEQGRPAAAEDEEE